MVAVEEFLQLQLQLQGATSACMLQGYLHKRMTTSTPSIESADVSSVDEFLTYLQVERQVSAHTLDAYRRDLAALVAWTGERNTEDGAQQTATPVDSAQLDSAHLRQFVAAEHRRGLSPKSLQRRLSACRSYYAWLLKHGRIAASP
ncbi:recombinase XerC, partial [Xanthomonas oryzae pv. oryzae]